MGLEKIGVGLWAEEECNEEGKNVGIYVCLPGFWFSTEKSAWRDFIRLSCDQHSTGPYLCRTAYAAEDLA